MLEIGGKDTFEERVNIILDELALGTQWESSSLILAIYRSVQIKNLVQVSFNKYLKKSRQVILQYVVDKHHYDIPLELLEHPLRKQAVFFVSGLRWGGGRGYSNAYRALNMHREYLVEGNVKAVFWLTENEAKQLARHAPDFWAFRHKVVEFLELPSIQNSQTLESFHGSFHKLYSKNSPDFQGWINTAESLYSLGCVDEAILNFRKAHRKYPQEIAVELQIAEILLSAGRTTAAGRILQRLNKSGTGKRSIVRELERLNQLAALTQPSRGGFLE
jgi:hypothetical protein